MNNTHKMALALHAAGINPLPVHEDGSKAPALTSWTLYINRRVTVEEIARWWAKPRAGVGIVAGHISNNHLMIEWEGRAVDADLPTQAAELAEASGLSELWKRLLATWIVLTPSGGLHFHIRTKGFNPPGNTKLARRPATPEELRDNPTDRIKVLAETRGEGGFIVTAPSHGGVHPSGEPWQTLQGGPDTITEFTGDELDAILTIFRAFDQLPEPATAPHPQLPTPTGDDARPGDDYNNRGDLHALLSDADWTPVYTRAGTTYWRRPGKKAGISASTGHAGDAERLWVWSTSTVFPDNTPITKFAAYAILRHDGNYTAAAKDLRRQGYGGNNVIPLRSVRPLPPDIEGAMALHPSAQPDTINTNNITLTDSGNADLFINRWGHSSRYAPHRGQWIRWDGVRWRPDETGTTLALFQETIRAITPNNEALAKHQTRSLSYGALTAAKKIAEATPEIVAGAGDLDAHPYLFATPTGYIDLRTGETTPPDPALLLTQCALVGPDTTPTPLWDGFLTETFAGVEEVIPYVQRLLGYSASGSTEFHILPFLLGGGQNGKSVLLDVIRKLLGDYATVQPSSFLMAHRSNDHETVIARLAGKRFVACSEINEDDRFDEAKVKSLTGGDALTARFLHRNHFTFTPSHKLWLAGNNQPRIPTGGRSIWRRVKLIPFPNEVPDDKRVPDLAAKLVEKEGPGILAWILRGAVKAFAAGLNEPGVVQAATSEYAAEEDQLSRFVAECATIGGAPHVKIKVRDAYAAYVAWCSDSHETPITHQAFGRRLKQRFGVGSVSDRVGARTARFYEGLSVTRSSDPDEINTHDRYR